MKKVKVLQYNNLPTRPPAVSTALMYLLLDKYNAPGWLWGVIATLYAITWIVTIWKMIDEENVDIFDYKN